MTGLSAAIAPPVTYSCSLADLVLFADCAAELDAYKDCLAYTPAERSRVIILLERLHDTVERIAGSDGHHIYAPDDEPVREGSL